MSFHGILEQVCDALHYSYRDGVPERIRCMKHAHLTFYMMPLDFSNPLFEIYVSEHVTVDVKQLRFESALIHALIYFDEVLGFMIRDTNYIAFLRGM